MSEPTSTHEDALSALSAHPHAWRFRALCADDSDPARRDAMREKVRRLATEWTPEKAQAQARPTVRESLARTRAMRACPYRSTLRCGCSGGACGLRGGAKVSHRDCFDCQERYPDG